MFDEKKDKLIEAYSDQMFSNEIKRKLPDIKEFLSKVIENVVADIKRTESTLSKPFLYIKEPEHRVKSLDSFKEKIERKSYLLKWNISKNKRKNVALIKKELGDLVGFRFLCYFHDHEELLFNKIKSYLENGSFKGYSWDFNQDCIQKNGHHIYKFQGFYKGLPFEVQIKSLASSLWGEVEHSQSYKNTSYSIYDESKKELFDNLFDILRGVDSELVSIYKLRYREDKLVKSIFYLLCSDSLKKEYGFIPNAQIFNKFDILLNSETYPKIKDDVAIFVGHHLLNDVINFKCANPVFSKGTHYDMINNILKKYNGHVLNVMRSIFSVLYHNGDDLFDDFLIDYVECCAFKHIEEVDNDSFEEEECIDQNKLIDDVLSGLIVN